MKMFRSATICTLMLALTVGLVGCRKNQTQPAPQPAPVETTTNPTPAPQTKKLILYKYKFNPNALTVPVGTTVIFENKDPEQHNVHIKSLNIDKMLRTNESFSYTFNRAGTYAVTNRVSNNPMNATITVR